MMRNGAGIVNLVYVLDDEIADIVSDNQWHFFVLVMISFDYMSVVALILYRFSDELDQDINDMDIQLSP